MKTEQVTPVFERTPDRDVILFKGEVFVFFDSGLTRNVFVNHDKTKVVKVLINPDSKDFNKEEFEVYENASDETKTKMAFTEIQSGLIVQEFCEPQKKAKRKMTIPQMMFSSSCRDEVGWTKDGRLVCFDLDEFKKY